MTPGSEAERWGGMNQGACWAAVGVWLGKQGLTIGHQGRQWTFQSTLLVVAAAVDGCVVGVCQCSEGVSAGMERGNTWVLVI